MNKRKKRKRKVYREIMRSLDDLTITIEYLPYQKTGVPGFQTHQILPAIEELKQLVEEYPTSEGSLYKNMPDKLWRLFNRIKKVY